MEKKSLLIIGSGYYTLGDSKNFGCIFSSIVQWLKENKINYKDFKVDILLRNKANIKNKTKLINKHFLFFKRKINFNFIILNELETNYDAL